MIMMDVIIINYPLISARFAIVSAPVLIFLDLSVFDDLESYYIGAITVANL